jgi:hypothetical protein
LVGAGSELRGWPGRGSTRNVGRSSRRAADSPECDSQLVAARFDSAGGRMLSSTFSAATTGAGAGAGAGAITAATGAGAVISMGAGVLIGAITGATGSGANGFLYSLFEVMTSRELGV